MGPTPASALKQARNGPDGQKQGDPMPQAGSDLVRRVGRLASQDQSAEGGLPEPHPPNRGAPGLDLATTVYSASGASRSHGSVDAHDTREGEVGGDGPELEKTRTRYDPDFEVKWTGPDDPDNPQSMGSLRKWVIVLLMASTSSCVTCTSSIYTLTYAQLEQQFDCSRIVATLGLSLFVIGLGLGPMLLAPLSEFYGRRKVYIVSLIIYVLWFAPCAAAQNIQTLLVGRFFSGFFGAAFLTVAGGTVGDMFTKETLAIPMTVFTASPFLGPEVGPIMGGFVNQYLYWRWSFYIMTIWTTVQFLLILFLVPDTYHPTLLREKAKQLRKQSGDERWWAPMEKNKKSIPKTILRSCYVPIQLLTLEPMCLNLCLFSAILLGILYLFFGAFDLVFTQTYNFELWQVGMAFTGMLVGMLIGVASSPYWSRRYLQLLEKHEAAGNPPGSSEPEFRLPPALLGGVLCPIGLFWFGWTIYPSIHWMVPIVGSGVFGLGTLLLFASIFTFLVDAYPLYAASALGANSIARSSFAAAFPLFGNQMYERLGQQWATSVLAFLTLAMAPFPFIFFRYGKRIRGTSRFATTDQGRGSAAASSK